jgi:hypothetical protein
MKSGVLPKTGQQSADELVAGTDKDPRRLAEVSDTEPPAEPDGSGDTEPAMSEA